MSDSRFGSPNESSQLSACRIASDPDSPDFQEALRRKNLFFQVASKLLARLQDSITAYEAFHSEETSTTMLKPPSGCPTEVNSLQTRHGRTPSKTFVGKILHRAAARLEELPSPLEIRLEPKKEKTLDKASEKYVKKFRLPRHETLLKECEAAWQPEADNPLEGRLYIGEMFVCFFGNGFAFHTKAVVPLSQVASWEVSNSRLVLGMKPEESSEGQYVFLLKGKQTEDQVRTILGNHATNQKLLKQRPVTLKRKESWVLKHHIDPVASEAFNLQDCILLLDCSRRYVYKAGEVIVAANSRHEQPGMWKIASGRVKVVSKDGQVTAVLGKNSFFGEISFFFPEVSMNASIIALDEVVEVFFLEGAKLYTHFALYPNFGARFYKYIATIAAHRFERFNRMFLSQFSDQPYCQDTAQLQFVPGHEQEEEFMVLLTNQAIKFASSQGEVGKVNLAEIMSISQDGDSSITVQTRSDLNLCLRYQSNVSNWFATIDSACFSSYEIKLIQPSEKRELLKKLYRTKEDCEMRYTSHTGEAIELWLYNPLRGTIISLAVDRHVQFTWDGVR